MTQTQLNLPSIEDVKKMYEDSFEDFSLFQGGFLNFGYWHRTSNEGSITTDERIESSKNLYRYVAKDIGIQKDDLVLEVGSGMGLGTCLILKEFSPTKLVGTDFSDIQMNRANSLNKQFLQIHNNLTFQVENAEELSFESSSFTKIFSIEAAQHFFSLMDFLNESYRVLMKNGKIGIATFFANDSYSSHEGSNLIPTVRTGVDKLLPISHVKDLLHKTGFENIRIIKIGENVWPFFDKWLSQGELNDSWDRNWYKGYKKNFWDYYVITADKN